MIRITTGIFLLAFLAAATVTAVRGTPKPVASDEFSYLFAARTFASGHLTNPTPEGWQQMVRKQWIFVPTHMSKYPPAQGLFLALGIVLGHPIIGVWISFALMAAATSWMLLAFVAPKWAFLGGLFVILNPMLGAGGYWAQSYWGGAVAAGGGALLIGAAKRDFRFSISLTLILGLALLANSRPYEGLALSIPVGIGLIYDRGLRAGLTVILLFLPILGMMGFYHYSITGNPFNTPFQVYAAQYDIAPKFIFQDLNPSPTYRPADESESSELRLYRIERTPIGFIAKNGIYFGWWFLTSFNVLLIPMLINRWWHDKRLFWNYGAVLLASAFTVPVMLHYLAPIYPLNIVFATNAVSGNEGRIQWKL